ncbi:MAG: TonB-dependent receptor plug domain-containing protein [Thermoanaerobaculia bacterium]
MDRAEPRPSPRLRPRCVGAGGDGQRLRRRERRPGRCPARSDRDPRGSGRPPRAGDQRPGPGSLPEPRPRDLEPDGRARRVLDGRVPGDRRARGTQHQPREVTLRSGRGGHHRDLREPAADERKLAAGTTISQVELEKIPTARDLWSVLSQTPGVSVDRVNVGGNESGQQAVFTAPGVSDDENSFLVDGVEITDMAAMGSSSTYYDFDQFTEMQFSTGGTDVTKASAGVSVNLVTKRGTNEFRGSARFLRTDDDFFAGFLEQDTPLIEQPDGDLGANQQSFLGNSINKITDYGFEAGGPVLRDKLWVWGSFGTNDIKNRTGGSTLADAQADDTVLENTAPGRSTRSWVSRTRWSPRGTTATSRSSAVRRAPAGRSRRLGISAVRRLSTSSRTPTS